MRPIDKGNAPRDNNGNEKVYIPYKLAKEDLIKAIGCYCSYCEMNITNQPDIEHVLPKSLHPDLIPKWNNLLLACKTCNTIKSSKYVNENDLALPHIHNTSFLYEYSIDNVCVNAYLDDNVKQLAQKTFDLVKLNRRVDISNRLDDRMYARLSSWRKAQEALEDLKKLPDNNNLINATARCCDGFFSMWIQIFKDYPKVKRLILESVNGTALDCYDNNFSPKHSIKRR